MLQRSRAEPQTGSSYGQYVNPQWSRLLDVLQMNVTYTRCRGAELETSDGRVILDFLSGYCVHNVGHNHPRLIEALKRELDRMGPAMLQSHVSDLAGGLGEALCVRAGGRLAKVFFASSGSEGIEATIKFARAHTRRAGILYAAGAFHGLTCGALSLMSNDFWKDGFGPLLPGTEAVPFGDIDAVERKLAAKTFAAFVLEPLQAEGGIHVPEPDYLSAVQALCRRYGTLFILDEVQTGLYRTGKFLAAHHFGVEPDMVVLAKALSGGLVPSSAVLMSEPIYQSVYGSLRRAIVHTSTYSENSLAMRAGLTTIDILEQEGLGQRATKAGAHLRRALTDRLSKYEMVARGARPRAAERDRVPAAALASAAHFVSGIRARPSGNVRTNAGHAAVSRPRRPEPGLRQQFHGAEGRAAAWSSTTGKSNIMSARSNRSWN